MLIKLTFTLIQLIYDLNARARVALIKVFFYIDSNRNKLILWIINFNLIQLKEK